MILLAHIMMFPVEEMLIPLAGGAGAALWLAAAIGVRTWRPYKTHRH